jgi:ParB/RepB/Spo0J family partition protein
MSAVVDKMTRFHETAANIANVIGDENEYEKRRAGIAHLKTMNGKLVLLPIDKIDVTKNVRFEVEDRDFEALVESIRAVGLLSPVIVTVVDDSVLCVAGHRRLAALKALGEAKATCIYRDFSTFDDVSMAQLVENMVRSDLHALDVAEGLHALKEKGYSQEKIAQVFDKSRFTIGRYQKIGAWPKEVKDIIRQHRNQFGTRDLIHLASRTLSEETLLHTLKVKLGLEKETESEFSSVELKERIDDIRVKLGVTLAVRGTMAKGALTLKYKNQAELDAILERLS